MPLMPTLHGFCPLVILQLNSDPLQVKRIYSFLLSGLQMVAKNQKLSLPPMDGLFSMEAKRYGRQRFGNMSREAVHGAVLRNGNFAIFEDLRFAYGTGSCWRKRLPLSNGSFITESRVQEVVEAFGTVYKGILPSGSGNSVAERKLEKVVGEGEKEFKAEVNVIGQTHHKNPGRLLGFTAMRVNTDFWCMSSCTMALYQASFSEAPEDLCLNEECSKQIIHCNIKASEHNSWMILLQPKLQTLAGKASDKQPDLNTHRHQRDYGVYSENSGSLYLL
ncbi:G-type lectin S-receptor-like serine/threonine-protein kinase LECRK3 [Vitis vinifera]|uniref:G-type lectin S-receptor-like serine/threonine-protein kinase LECRK3 n=1 Tax=Vitis vinifera TaxID=29760 RepID=A0A438IA09_VITVI|nr:G-type lectin S-receptor-like serine/threonine-protein kinase LECRK3 [Vitis vinifera]